MTEFLNDIGKLVSGLTAEQIALFSIIITFLIYTLGKKYELKMKKHELKKEQYIKLIKLFEKVYNHTNKAKEKRKDTQRDISQKEKEEFFDLGSSLLLY